MGTKKRLLDLAVKKVVVSFVKISEQNPVSGA